MLFSLLLRVSTGVNKQLICSFCPRGQRESGSTQMGRLYCITYLTFSHNQFSTTKLGQNWVSVRGRKVIISLPWTVTRLGLFGKKMTWEIWDSWQAQQSEMWVHLTPWSSLVTMPGLAELKIAINKQTPVNAPHTHVLLWRFSFICKQTSGRLELELVHKAVTQLSTPSNEWYGMSRWLPVPPPPTS